MLLSPNVLLPLWLCKRGLLPTYFSPDSSNVLLPSKMNASVPVFLNLQIGPREKNLQVNFNWFYFQPLHVSFTTATQMFMS